MGENGDLDGDQSGKGQNRPMEHQKKKITWYCFLESDETLYFWLVDMVRMAA
jgi:hypothetical protein